MILMRHGQSEFNLHFTATRRDPGIHDPRLTNEGEAQAREAARALAGSGIRRVIASPYTRALQTAAPIAAARGVPVRIEVGVRERFHFSCDIGSPRVRLEERWPGHDFSALENQWWPDSEESHAAVEVRAARFREAMLAQPDWRQTLVVSHWAFILTLTGQSLENGTWITHDLTVAHAVGAF